MAQPVLQHDAIAFAVRGLKKIYATEAGEVQALRGVDLDIRSGEVVGALTDHEAEVSSGLKAGEQVVVFPSDKVKDGVGIRARS